MKKVKRLAIKSVVTLKTDPQQLPRIITRYQVSPQCTMYELALGDMCSWHYRFEIRSKLEKRSVIAGFKNRK